MTRPLTTAPMNDPGLNLYNRTALQKSLPVPQTFEAGSRKIEKLLMHVEEPKLRRKGLKI
jgi:hypothetical protein